MTLGDTELIPLIRSCAHDMHHVTEEDIRLLAYRLAHSPLQFDPARRRSWSECTCRKVYLGDTTTIGAMEDDPTCPYHHPVPGPAPYDPLLDVRHEEDGSWSVSVRAMPGHVGCGMTLEDAYAEAHDAALAWVEAATMHDTAQEEKARWYHMGRQRGLAERPAPDDLFAASKALKRAARHAPVRDPGPPRGPDTTLDPRHPTRPAPDTSLREAAIKLMYQRMGDRNWHTADGIGVIVPIAALRAALEAER